MGFLLWAALSAWAGAAGLLLARKWAGALPLGEQLVAAWVAALSLVLGAMQLLGYASLLTPTALGLLVFAAGGAVLLYARDGARDLGAFGARLRRTAWASVATPASGLVTACTAALVLYLGVYVVLLPSWGWDAMWYHNAISLYAYQTHSLAWVDSHIPFVNSYPKGVELLALWNGIFAPDGRLLDAAQLPLSLLGVLSVAAMARRAGAPAPLAWGLGQLWLWMPAVWLNVPSDYNDAGAAGLWLACALFLARAELPLAARRFGALGLGLIVGAKVSGALYGALVAPGVAYGVWKGLRAEHPNASLRSHLLRLTGSLLGMAATGLLLGGATYVRDIARFGNPVWPAKVPVLGHTLPGTWEMSSFNTPPFGGPDNLAALWRSFTNLKPFWFVDVREGGFGPLWVGVLLPVALGVLLWSLVQLLRRKPVAGSAAVWALFFTALLTPARWWARYTLGFPAAGLVAVASALGGLKRRWVQQLVLGGLAVFAAAQSWPGHEGLRGPPELLAQAWSMAPLEREHLHFGDWQQERIALRDALVQPGEASAYDDSVSFIGQLWRSDWQNRVLYLPLKGDPAAWLARLDQEQVRWAAVGRGAPERALQAAGWVRLYPCVSEGCMVWVRPGTDVAAAAQAR
jgi:hypothetical protein